MNILGVSCYYHDAAAALLQDGMLVAAAEEERFTRKKHDSNFPTLAIRFCLEQAGINPGDLDYAVFYEKPLVKFERILTTAISTFPRSAEMFSEAMIAQFDNKLWIRSLLASHLGLPTGKILFVDHHVAHAASAFFCSPFKEAAILTVDGVGEWTTTATGSATADWNGQGSSAIRLSHEMRFPHSLGLLYSTFTAFLGFEVNEGEYKVMGMAPYGAPRFLDELGDVVRVASDGSIELNLDYFSFAHSTEQSFSRKLVDLLGPPRVPESDFFTPRSHPERSPSKAVENQRFADIAASLQ